MPSEVVLTIGWNVLSHMELEPAHCGDENCEADHGYTGTMTADDLTHAGQRGRRRRGSGAARCWRSPLALTEATTHPGR